MDENIIEYLTNIDFTSYEAKVFSALITLGQTTATKISIFSKVPRARIYDVLTTLEAKGWIQSVQTKPLKYCSISLDKAKQKLNEIEQNFKKNKQIILDELETTITQENNTLEDQDIVIDTTKTIDTIKYAIAQTKNTLLIFRLYYKNVIIFLNQLKRAKKAGIKIKLILNDEPPKNILYKLKAVAEVKIAYSQISQASLYSDNSYIINIFQKDKNLYATILRYKKCIYCLQAWLKREWEEI